MKVDEIIRGMRDKNQKLSVKVDELESLSEAKAQAEKLYRMEYAKKVFELKSEGVAITVCKTLAKGDKRVAELKYQFDVKEGVFNACRERIRTLNTAIDTYRSLLSWNRTEFEKSGMS